MKKAFTLLELIFVIVVIGIIAAVAIPRMKSNSLREAAAQVLGHIRYTQHLAMSSDVYKDTDEEWYKKRWQIKFSNVGGSDDMWAYAIFYDRTADGNPNASETAINPSDMTKKLTGGYSGTIEYDDKEATQTLNLGHAYNVRDIDFEDCNINNNDHKKRIVFDYLGRPLTDSPKNLVNSFETSSKNLLLNKTCKIKLCSVDDCIDANEDQQVVISIQKETGYAEIIEN
jgi:prepilin-type N-terminal cleavage/methylation domain-containing protein